MKRNDSGTTLVETLVVMVVVGMMLGGVLSTLYASVKLVQSAPTDTNPPRIRGTRHRGGSARRRDHPGVVVR